MSLNIISGLPRNGKSYYCCTRIIDDLTIDKRNIYTNLPLNPDFIARKVAVNLCSKTERYLDLIDDVLKRIHLFVNFSKSDYKKFRKLNPRYCYLHCHRSKKYDDNIISTQKLIFKFDLIADYWNHCKANSIFYWDECYQIWNYLDSSERSGNAKERRKELQNYMRMHGHDKDDIYLISHKERDLDRFVLDTCSYHINVRNSKKWPILPEEYAVKYWWLSWLAPLKWPIQFFIIRTFIGDEKVCHRSFCKASRAYIFKCYNSLSAPNGLRDRGASLSDSGSSDYKHSFAREVKEWLTDAWLPLLILVFLVSFFYGVYKGLRNISKPKSSQKVVKTEQVDSSDKSISKTKSSSKSNKSNSERVVVSAISPQAVYLSNGDCIRVGDQYGLQNKIFTVVSVSRSFVTVDCDGKQFKVKPTGFIERDKI